jgi:hypothetical protein
MDPRCDSKKFKTLAELRTSKSLAWLSSSRKLLITPSREEDTTVILQLAYSNLAFNLLNYIFDSHTDLRE